MIDDFVSLCTKSRIKQNCLLSKQFSFLYDGFQKNIYICHNENFISLEGLFNIITFRMERKHFVVVQFYLRHIHINFGFACLHGLDGFLNGYLPLNSVSCQIPVNLQRS